MPNLTIVNLTQHFSTPDQQCKEPTNKKLVQELLTFTEIPSVEEMEYRANKLVEIVYFEQVEYAMIGGAPFFMSILENALINNNIIPLYAFSTIEPIKTQDDDGNLVKTSVFKHIGWVRVQ